MLVRTVKTLFVVLILVLFIQQSQAQHANLVLFGEPNPAAKEVPAEHIFVHPVTAPYAHEDSFVTTDIRIWHLQHKLPGNGVLGSGRIVGTAVQVRAALTDQLQLVAYKDGYLEFDSAVVNDSGWADLGVGVKYNFLQDWNNQFHMAVGVGYEIGSGNDSVLQGDDEIRLWVSANKGYDAFHLGGTLNYNISMDQDQVSYGGALPTGGSDTISWHLHADYYLNEFVSPVLELNGYHTVNSGSKASGALDTSGVDLANLGGGTGEDVITLGVGAELRFFEQANIRVAYETPITDANDLWGHRWTFSVVVPF